MRNYIRENGNRGGQHPFDVSDLNLPPWTGRAIKWGLAGIVIILLFIALSWGRGVFTDWLWFNNLGYLDVFQTILVTRIWLFFAAACLFTLFAVPNIYLVFRLTRNDTPPTLTPQTYQLVRRVLAWLAGIAVVIAALSFGAAAGGRWETVLMFANSTPFIQADGTALVDPIHEKGLDFYVFTLPLLGFIRGWFLGVAIVILLFVLALYLAFYSLRERGFTISRDVKAHVVGIGAALFVVIAAGHWLGRYELLYSPSGFVFGVGFTDDNARMTVRLILTIIALLSGALMVAGIFASGYRLVIGAFGLWVGMAILVGGLYPALVQRFQVEPSEFSKEEPFIENNLQFTRTAYDIDLKPEQIRSHAGLENITPEIIEQNRGTIDNIRLWDERPLSEIYNQVEFVQFYYDFQQVGVDRYELNNQVQQVMLSSRELAAEKLPQEAQNWVNRHLVFTHGHGVAMSPVNRVEPDGKPSTYLRNVPTTPAPGFEELALEQAGIYYGLKSLSFVIVNTKERELDFQGESGESVFTDGYKGEGGVRLSSLLRRLAYTWEFTDINILISGQIDNSKSSIQYRRTVPERVDTLSPFLLRDSDPYQVVADGRIFFIQDAYTVTSQYPYSTPSAAGGFNYIRNSVKVVVDTFNGTVDYYIFDPDDPLVQTYQKIFPDLFKDQDEFPPYLREHIRYPRDLFTVQTRLMLQYHMTEPSNFFQKADQWSIPVQNSFGREGILEPYYILARLPGEEKEEFLLIQPFTPDRRDPLEAWIAVRNDEPYYGEIVLFRFPEGRSILGPNQIEARIDNDPAISQQFTLWGQVGSEVQRGNMLVIPLGDSILYAEPIFLKPEALDFPELRRIILADGQRVVMQPTLEKAVRALKGEIAAVAPAVAEEGEFLTPIPGETPTPVPTTPPEGVVLTPEEIDILRSALKDLGAKIAEIDAILEKLAPPSESQ